VLLIMMASQLPWKSWKSYWFQLAHIKLKVGTNHLQAKEMKTIPPGTLATTILVEVFQKSSLWIRTPLFNNCELSIYLTHATYMTNFIKCCHNYVSPFHLITLLFMFKLHMDLMQPCTKFAQKFGTWVL